jgi:hypothetical protein
MPKRARTKQAAASPSPAAERPGTVHSSLYLHPAVYDALREIAYTERLKIHAVVLEGIDAALRRRGYPSVEALKTGKRR